MHWNQSNTAEFVPSLCLNKASAFHALESAHFSNLFIYLSQASIKPAHFMHWNKNTHQRLALFGFASIKPAHFMHWNGKWVIYR